MSKPTRRRKPGPVHFADDMSYAWQEANGGHIIKVSVEDADLLAAYVWTAVKRGRPGGHVIWYAVRAVKGRDEKVYLHREITGAVGKAVVDHDNHDGLDCRRANLRPGISQAENGGNQRKTTRPTTSRYKGVTRKAGETRWIAQMGGGKRRYLGRFDCEIAAAKAYDAAARAHFGPFAHTNFN